jgi:hypothetical protein
MFHLPRVLALHSNPSFVAPQPSLVKVVALTRKKEKKSMSSLRPFFKIQCTMFLVFSFQVQIQLEYPQFFYTMLKNALNS